MLRIATTFPISRSSARTDSSWRGVFWDSIGRDGWCDDSASEKRVGYLGDMVAPSPTIADRHVQRGRIDQANALTRNAIWREIGSWNSERKSHGFPLASVVLQVGHMNVVELASWHSSELGPEVSWAVDMLRFVVARTAT